MATHISLKCSWVVIRYLHYSTLDDMIVSELKELGFSVKNVNIEKKDNCPTAGVSGGHPDN